MVGVPGGSISKRSMCPITCGSPIYSYTYVQPLSTQAWETYKGCGGKSESSRQRILRRQSANAFTICLVKSYFIYQLRCYGYCVYGAWLVASLKYWCFAARKFKFHNANVSIVKVFCKYFIDLFMGFSDRLRQVIERKGITPYELSMRTNISQATLSRIFTNSTAKPSSRTVGAIAKYLHISAEWLLTGNGEMESQPVENADIVSIPREAWDVIRSQAASLERKDRQVDEVLAMLRAEMKKGEDADYPGHAATQAAAE